MEKKLQEIANKVSKCRKCGLWKNRNNSVVGEGSVDAEVFFIGEAPGRNEDIQGRPFVGKAGKILDELLKEAGLERKEVYISNVLKCRPPKNRDPLQSEIDKCTSYLNRQLQTIQPEVISPLGSFATSYIFKKFDIKENKISKVHGEVFNVNTISGLIKVVPMYHPAVATYNPNKKKILLKDIQKIKENI